ncbi:MAG: hypothetical protein CL687_02720 [Candidatus Pelagibacter sp.]|nr:hypothetical protein [Candidatus Pelagibacter sp.]OUW24150.1 MAG: hypothetical protein CBD34_01450 [Rickettsiales bacterium TMED174]|tara:strand:+ start:643 stop:1062 length:420 start_codon:yes stop_codon:yes gene_type:complete
MRKIIIIVLSLFIFNPKSYSENNYLSVGIELYENKKYMEAKFKFEQEIVRNPKSEISYLYLAKIFKIQKKDELLERNLDTTILINPRNEEALYELILLKIKKSDFLESESLINKFNLICEKMCTKKDYLVKLRQNSLKK